MPCLCPAVIAFLVIGFAILILSSEGYVKTNSDYPRWWLNSRYEPRRVLNNYSPRGYLTLDPPTKCAYPTLCDQEGPLYYNPTNNTHYYLTVANREPYGVENTEIGMKKMSHGELDNQELLDYSYIKREKDAARYF